MLCDFGLATAMEDFASGLTTSRFNGHHTTRFASPELVFDDAARRSVRSDIWAYGCLVLEASGEPTLPTEWYPAYYCLIGDHRSTLVCRSPRGGVHYYQDDEQATSCRPIPTLGSTWHRHAPFQLLEVEPGSPANRSEMSEDSCRRNSKRAVSRQPNKRPIKSAAA